MLMIFFVLMCGIASCIKMCIHRTTEEGRWGRTWKDLLDLSRCPREEPINTARMCMRSLSACFKHFQQSGVSKISFPFSVSSSSGQMPLWCFGFTPCSLSSFLDICSAVLVRTQRTVFSSHLWSMLTTTTGYSCRVEQRGLLPLP